jgi:hypothetical protein
MVTRGSIEDLGLDAESTNSWFVAEVDEPHVLARMSAELAIALPEHMGVAVRRCYVADSVLQSRATATGRPATEVIAAVLPDRGSTMAGDFGEILVFAHLAASKHPTVVSGPFKWRLKQDRTKPAPHSDVVLFVLPVWPAASNQDVLICAEVKTKSLPGNSNPIPEAIRDSAKDRTSRLAKTLEWLRERALLGDVDGASIDVLNRFAHASDHPEGRKEFYAVAVVSDDLEYHELATMPADIPPELSLVVLIVPGLHSVYEQVFAHASRADAPPAA